jgi:3-dehydroquinate synthase
LEKITIKTGTHSSDILIGESHRNVLKYMTGRNTVIITDENVRRIYGDVFPGFPVLSVVPGEESKNLKTIEHLVEGLLSYRLDRSGFILAIGGGVVCDISGFLASVYMRGIPFGFISTSLLSQVDASVGGKNGVNIGAVKNVVGNFNQPDFVICDVSMLKSLSDDEYLSGLSELIKMGIIMDDTLLGEIEKNREKIIERDLSVLETLIACSVKLKADIVTEDERESGVRMILNFGHTFGHVIETVGHQKHGYAVASGMVIAAGISEKEGLLGVKDLTRIVTLLKHFNLLKKFDIAPSKFAEMIRSDKKKSGEEISFVYIGKPGHAMVKKTRVDKLVEDYEKVYHLL